MYPPVEYVSVKTQNETYHLAASATALVHTTAVVIHRYKKTSDMGAAAAAHAGTRIRELSDQQKLLSVVFATGASQLPMLGALRSIPGIPWQRMIGFHMDEYLGISDQHPASFRHYLRQELWGRVPMREFHEIDGNAADPEGFCRYYGDLLLRHAPQLCLLGIGENGHLAFNDPAEADFSDPKDVKVVSLDRECRQQQVNERWFPTLAEVPEKAITVTIPALLRIPELILSVPGERKREVVRRTLNDEISTRCPATILRMHPNTHLYVDAESDPEA